MYRILIALLIPFSITAFLAVPIVGAPTPVISEETVLAIDDLPSDEVFGDFVVGPGKVDVLLAPGATTTVYLRVSNRMGDDKMFNVEVEDFAGTQDPNQTIVLLGDERGPYSLKDYVRPATTTFPVDHATRVTIPVTITVPSDAEPGGRYGSVLISTVSKNADVGARDGAQSGAAIVSRIGVLFFVRIEGEAVEEGKLTSFDTKDSRRLFQGGEIPLEILYENTGSVHLNPYGYITIKNIFGEVIGAQELDPWFTLPKSLRLREVTWERALLVGRYTAELQLNRGYDDIVESASVSFWVIPIKMVVLVLSGLFILMIILRWITKNFEIKKK